MKYLILILCLCSCVKTNFKGAYYVEDFRVGDMNDYQTVQAALDSIPNNSTLIFPGKTYSFNHTPTTDKSIKFIGHRTILTRENQITYTLIKPSDENSGYVILDNADGLQVLDRVCLAINSTTTGTTSLAAIHHIVGDTVFFYSPIGKTLTGLSPYPAGTKFYKSILLFWALSNKIYTNSSCSFSNFIFDGNRDNNKGTISWNMNTAVVAITKGTTTYRGCEIRNSPNESIVGHNTIIENCYFHDLNGSGYHTSADKVYCSESEIHSVIKNSLFENTNQISSSITGHSEGAITHSNSGGYYTATGNTFKNVGESVLGALYSSQHVHDWGTSNILFTRNTINGAGRIIYLIDTTRPPLLHDVRIEKNHVTNMPYHNYSKEIDFYKSDIILEQ